MRIRRLLQGTAVTALSVLAWAGAGSADTSAIQVIKKYYLA